MIRESATSSTLRRYGIDLRQLSTLIKVYIKQDLRSGKVLVQFNKREYITSNRALFGIVMLYTFFGLIIGVMAFTDLDVLIYSLMALSFTFFTVALALIAESGNVIFDESEVDVLGHLPVNARTHLAAKVVNLLLFVLLLATAINLFPAIFGIWAQGSNVAFVVAHVVSASCIGMFAIALVVLSYGLVMRYAGKERFDSIVAYSQVALALLFMLGYQLLPRILQKEQMQLIGGFRWYYVLYPPSWFTGIEMLLIGKIDDYSLSFTALASLSLVVLGAVAFRKLAASYSSATLNLGYQQASLRSKGKLASHPSKISESKPGHYYAAIWRRVRVSLVRRPVERAVFDLVSIYFRRNREIKVRLYPSVAYFIFLPLLAVFTDGLPDPLAGRHPSWFSLVGAGMICFVALAAIEALNFSEHYPAAYIFRVAPISQAGEVYRGWRKAVLVFIAAPGFAALFALYSLLWRNPLHAFLVLLPWITATPSVMVLPFIFRQPVPLSRKYQKGQQSGRTTAVLLVSLVGVSFLTGLQVLALRGYVPYLAFVALAAIASWSIYPLLRKLSRESRPLAQVDDNAAYFSGDIAHRRGESP